MLNSVNIVLGKAVNTLIKLCSSKNFSTIECHIFYAEDTGIDVVVTYLVGEDKDAARRYQLELPSDIKNLFKESFVPLKKWVELDYDKPIKTIILKILPNGQFVPEIIPEDFTKYKPD